jgi:hypothetical protein
MTLWELIVMLWHHNPMGLVTIVVLIGIPVAGVIHEWKERRNA